MREEKTKPYEPPLDGKIVLFTQFPKHTVMEAVSEAMKGLTKVATRAAAAFTEGSISNYIKGIFKRTVKRQEAENRLREWGIDMERICCMEIPVNSEIKILLPTNESKQDKPPYVEVAEALTRQRAAGRRKKRNYHTRNRRKR